MVVDFVVVLQRLHDAQELLGLACVQCCCVALEVDAVSVANVLEKIRRC